MTSRKTLAEADASVSVAWTSVKWRVRKTTQPIAANLAPGAAFGERKAPNWPPSIPAEIPVTGYRLSHAAIDCMIAVGERVAREALSQFEKSATA